MEDSATGGKDDNLNKFSDTGFEPWFKLIFGVAYMAFGLFCIVVFFRAREVFEIRARSVYLVTTLGLLLLVYQGLNVDLQAIVLFGAPATFFRNNLVVFFVTFAIASCYISRVIRLAVGFSLQLRRKVPWLMSEKVLVITSLSVGLISVVIPLYYHFTINGVKAEERFRKKQSNNLWVCTLVLQVLQLILLPVVWVIDDLFHISRELIVIIVIGIFQTVFVKLAMGHYLTPEVERWINPPNLQFVATTVLFGLSIIDPVRRLKFSPMERSSAAMARAANRLESARARKARRGRQTNQISSSVEESSYSQNLWNYEKIAANPSVAEAFRAFANRALCQESIWFLEEVSRYQKEDYTIASPLGGGQAAAFEAITKRFITDGAPDEVNISDKDRNAILNLYNKGDQTFISDDEDELSGAFDRAYAEIRFMIEANILHKFTETPEFQRVANAPSTRRKRSGLFFLPC